MRGCFAPMALIDYISLPGDSLIGIWKNEESLDDLLMKLKPKADLLKKINGIKLEKRKKEFIISRLIIKELLGKYNEIIKLENGKPEFEKLHNKLSITHADKYSAVIISEKLECGIDMEAIQERINRLSHKFVSEYESIYANTAETKEYNTVIWCAKEAVFKWYANGNLDFRKHIVVHPFKVNDKGELFFELIADGKKITNRVHFRLIDNHVLAWTMF